MTALHAATALTPAGWRAGVRIVLDGAVIAAVETDVAPQAGDERHAILVPGVANLHSHAFQRAMAGLAEVRGAAADSFWTWRETMYRAALALDPDDVEAVAALAYAEMLEAGFTRVGEFHYLHHDRHGGAYGDVAEMAARIAAASAETGIGLTLLPVFYAHGGFGGRPALAEQRRFLSDLDGYARLLDGCRRHLAGLPGAVLGVAPHSLRAVAADELGPVAAMAGDGPVHIHVAEQVKEVEDSIAWSGARPVAWLLDRAAVDGRWCLIHATHVDDAERAAIAASGAVVGLCPVTEANLGDGVFPAEAFAAEGGRFGIGTDSNVQIGLGAELRQLEYSQRLTLRRRNVLARGPGSTGRALLDAAAAGGAAALGVGLPGIGLRGIGLPGIAAGRPADLVALDAGHPSLAGRTGDAILDGWIFATGADPVASVWAGGRRVVRGGRHLARDAITARYARTMAKLAARM